MASPRRIIAGALAAAALVAAGWGGVLLGTLCLFGVQAVVATVLDSPYASGGRRLVPLFVLFPIYFWVVIYPSFVLGTARAVRLTREPLWSRTERVARLAPTVPASP